MARYQAALLPVPAIIRVTIRALFFPLSSDAPVSRPTWYLPVLFQRAIPEGSPVGVTLYDCPWCGSAKAIEHGLCQVCLMEYPVETKVITLPTTLPALKERPAAVQEAVRGKQ